MRFSTVAEMDAKQLALAKRETSKRALRAALRTDKTHLWMPAVLLELGNAEADHGQADHAALWFDRLIRKTASSP